MIKFQAVTGNKSPPEIARKNVKMKMRQQHLVIGKRRLGLAKGFEFHK